MNAENTMKLVKRFPVIYQDFYSSPMESCMCFGFECGNGWFPIIWQLSLAIEEELGYSFLFKKWLLFKKALFKKWNAGIYYLSPPTRVPSKAKIYKDLRKELGLKRFVHWPDTGFKVCQVKEKYGTLRFYTDYSYKDTKKYIQLAEELSAVTCEQCGNPGKIYPSGWYMVMCPKCRKQLLQGKQHHA